MRSFLFLEWECLAEYVVACVISGMATLPLFDVEHRCDTVIKYIECSIVEPGEPVFLAMPNLEERSPAIARLV